MVSAYHARDVGLRPFGRLTGGPHRCRDVKKKSAPRPEAERPGVLQGSAGPDVLLSVPEIRRLLWRLVLAVQQTVIQISAWSRWRRWHNGPNIITTNSGVMPSAAAAWNAMHSSTCIRAAAPVSGCVCFRHRIPMPWVGANQRWYNQVSGAQSGGPSLSPTVTAGKMAGTVHVVVTH